MTTARVHDTSNEMLLDRLCKYRLVNRTVIGFKVSLCTPLILMIDFSHNAGAVSNFPVTIGIYPTFFEVGPRAVNVNPSPMFCFYKPIIAPVPKPGLCPFSNLDCLAQGGKCVAILPITCATAPSGVISNWKRIILERHTLDAVMSMPIDLFHNSKTTVVTCVMVFTAHRPHAKKYEFEFFFVLLDGRVLVWRIEQANRRLAGGHNSRSVLKAVAPIYVGLAVTVQHHI
jgi:hypothetical protein